MLFSTDKNILNKFSSKYEKFLKMATQAKKVQLALKSFSSEIFWLFVLMSEGTFFSSNYFGFIILLVKFCPKDPVACLKVHILFKYFKYTNKRI